ncbi:MAG: FAD-dependent monooxygenase [Planctomycetes bacterium]|nr:FAD-dependent monooxygenase [Planctomycetota bacterium]
MVERRFIIVGGGLGGALMAVYLGRAGYEVEVHEMRDDPRVAGTSAGRSINLAISHRGLCALDRVGLADEVLRHAVPMRGRMIHALDGTLAFQRYGKDDSQTINSVSRGGLNVLLLEAAAALPNVRLIFNRKCTNVQLESGAVEFTDTVSGERSTVEGGVVVSADGAFSAVRRAMQRLDRFNYSQYFIEHGYKELTIPAGAGGAFAMERNALHIWPRRSFMMIALPNAGGSFTCTLFWPFEGPVGFSALRTPDDVRRFFSEQFHDAVPLMPTLAEDYLEHPTASLPTVRCGPWYVEDRVVLLGDAAHAVVPFYGQGANAAFEDVLVLSECLERYPANRKRAFETFYELRKRNADAIADLALANFVEMRDHTGSRLFLLKKHAEHALHRLFPRWYLPLYTMVSFTRIPYADAARRARSQNRVVAVVCAALFLALIILGLFA